MMRFVPLVAACALSCAGVDTRAAKPGSEPGSSPDRVRDAQRAAPDAGTAAPAIADDSVAGEADILAPAPAAAAESLEITFVGDVMFGRYVQDGRATIPAGDYDLFERVTDLVRADIAVANLETPVLREVPPESPYGIRLRLGASREEAAHLVRAGFTAVTLANNHSYDLRLRGLEETPSVLRELGIIPLGMSHAEPPVFRADTVAIRGWRVAFIGITTERNGLQRAGQPVLPYVDSPREIPGVLIPVVESARGDHDIVVVLAHWGEENHEEPKRAQRAAGRALIDAGADLVIGHHPHLLQAFERYESGLIAYSLGNFRFDYASKISRLSGVLRARFRREGSCLERVTLHPVYTERARIEGKRVYRPAPATGRIGNKVRKRVIDKSAALGTDWEREGEDLVIRIPGCGASAVSP
jgi:poly-gamma-glutamate capsule biosynthesis protein CapA/YwtB (metallophosphatase superfamily)